MATSPLVCPSCHEHNDPQAIVCFACEAPLSRSAIRRGTLIAARYEVKKWLGRGGMGTVYHDHDRVLDEEVALKVLRADVAASADLTRRFRHEIKLARRIRHPNVCAIHEYGEDGDLRFISMELVEGTDLKKLIQQSGRLPSDVAFGVALEVAQGLQAIHGAGIIHRDLKTANIMRDARGVVRLMDFGIAKQFGAEVSQGATATGHVIGTPEYMSPEQARGEALDPRSDIYALGIVMFEIFTGDVPFHGDTPVATLFKQLQVPPPLHDGRLPPGLVRVLERALAKEATDRYPALGELIQDLGRARAEAVDGATVSNTPAPPGLRLPPADTEARATTVATHPTRPETISPRITTSPRTPETLGGGPMTLPERSQAVPVARTPAAAPRPPRSAPRSLSPIAAVAGAAGLIVLTGGVALMKWTAEPVASEPSSRPALPPAVSPPAMDATAPPLEAGASAIDGPTPAPVAPPPSPAVERAPILEATPAAIAPDRPRRTLPTPRPAAANPIAPWVRSDRGEAVKPAAEPSTSAMTATRAVGATEATPAAEAEGRLQIIVRPWDDVSVDGKAIGTTPFKPLSLASGTHTVVFTNPDYKPFQRRVVVRPNETSRLEVDLTWEAFKK